MYVIFAPLKRDKNHMVSHMAHAKILGEPFMAHLENLYNIPCCMFVSCVHPVQALSCVLHDLQFVNAGRGCHRRPYG